MALLEESPFDVVLADIRMPGMDGMEFLGRIKEGFPGLSVVMMTAFGTIDIAVQAIKEGAYDFITKPFEHDKLLHLLEKAFERSRLLRENLLLHRRIEQQESLDEIVGVSPKMQKIFDTIRLVERSRRNYPAHGRIRHRQGHGGPSRPQAEPQKKRSFRRGELPESSGKHSGE